MKISYVILIIYTNLYSFRKILLFNNNDNNNNNNNNPAAVLENDIHKLLWNFDIQTDHQIAARRPDLRVFNKKRELVKIVDFAVQLTTE